MRPACRTSRAALFAIGSTLGMIPALAHAAEPASPGDAAADPRSQAGVPARAATALPTAGSTACAAPTRDQILIDLCRQLNDQQRRIEEQDRRLTALEQAMTRAPVETAALDTMRGAGTGAAGAASEPPAAPVGEAPAPAPHDLEAKTAAIPPAQGVLTPAGHLVIEPDMEYVRSANDRLVFSGIELVPGLQLGVISAQTSQNDTFAPSLNFRYGLTSRLEADVTVPFLDRVENIQVVQQRDTQIVRNLHLSEAAFGDVEFGLRYQLNDQHGSDKPIFILNLKAKSTTGIGPFDVGYDQYGIATGLPTGSGFWAIEPGVTMLLPSDPVVIFASINGLAQIPRTLNKLVGGALVGRVDPGSAIQANTGFAFALNPRFSFSLGYTHTYVMPTNTYIGSAWEKSTGLQVGTLDMGVSYRITQRQTLNLQFNFGVTPDAPNLNVTLRVPFTL